MFKIPPRRVDASDCVVHIGRKVDDSKITDPGEAIAVHNGEWVEVLPIGTVLAYSALLDVVNMAETRDNAGLKSLCEALSERVTDWNWTGLDNKPLAKPYGNPKVFMSLNEDELIWLVTAVQGETKGERKNASGASAEKF